MPPRFHLFRSYRPLQAARIERGEARAEAARRRALDSVSDFNHRLVTERFSNRRCYWDLQTMQIHIPHPGYRLLPSPPYPKGAFPVAVIPGQFSEHFTEYTADQLMRLPLSRCVFGQPTRKHRQPPPLPVALRFGNLLQPASNLEKSDDAGEDAGDENESKVAVDGGAAEDAQ